MRSRSRSREHHRRRSSRSRSNDHGRRDRERGRGRSRDRPRERDRSRERHRDRKEHHIREKYRHTDDKSINRERHSERSESKEKNSQIRSRFIENTLRREKDKTDKLIASSNRSPMTETKNNIPSKLVTNGNSSPFKSSLDQSNDKDVNISNHGMEVDMIDGNDNTVEDDDEEDLDALEDFIEMDGFLDKKQKELEEAEKLAEERRKRLQQISQKYQPKEAAALSEGIETKKSGSAVDSQQNLSMEQDVSSPINPTDNAKQDTAETEHGNDEDEGKQLANEKSAIEAEEKRAENQKLTFDIFSSSPVDIQEISKLNAAPGKRAFREALLDGEDPHLQSNWDDFEGYYKARIGELIGNRFQILGVVGKGVFSTVLKCVDIRKDDGTQNVAVKMIRSNETMRRAAEKEKNILLALSEKDPHNKKFCVRLLTHFEYRNHVALVFEYQQMNLREALKKFGKDVGINVGAIRLYGRQLFVALKHLMDLKVVHADIKLDNILCSEDLKQVKLCDFGSAFYEYDTDNDPTPYLVSRFYRAPEIILGLPYDRAIDMWSVCVSLYELFTGHVMFPGRTNNEMLKLIMSIKGKFPNKMVKSHLRSYESMGIEPHFEQDYRFKHIETDTITGKPIKRLVEINNPTRDLSSILRVSKAGADDMKLVAGLTDLLEKGLNLDPSRRISVPEALKHPFFHSR